MNDEDMIIEQRLAGLRAKLTKNTHLSLRGITKQLLRAGFDLPSNGSDVSRFILQKADAGLKISTLRNYCSMIVKWHRMSEYGEAAADIANLATPVIDGLQTERQEEGRQESRKSAIPLLIQDALKIDAYLLRRVYEASGSGQALAVQDLALFRLLWWSGARESEITTLKRWQVTFNESPRGVVLEWAKTKTDKNGMGTTRLIPALPEADPMGALIDWLELYWPGKTTGDQSGVPIFRRQLRNGKWRDSHIHPNSIPLWLRKIAKSSGVPYWAKLSGHSCRHGLATMMSDNLSIREVMDYFKWKRVDTAIGYATNKSISANTILTLTDASRSQRTPLEMI